MLKAIEALNLAKEVQARRERAQEELARKFFESEEVTQAIRLSANDGRCAAFFELPSSFGVEARHALCRMFQECGYTIRSKAGSLWVDWSKAKGE